MPKENASSVESEEWRTLKETDAKTALTLAEAETLRDQYVLDYLTVAFGHPAVQSFYFWGFMGMATSFSPSPSSAHTLKPLYEKVRKRLHEEWNTAIQTTTNSKGEVKFRGFCGDYLGSITPKASSTKIGHRFQIKSSETNARLVVKTVL
ncbi:MAG: hypothetical protein HRU12_24440 [Phaeodactylibacter sp.]|nr:hypothetical protein [Phaeodactylibacter sp.]